jgi:hypothetical protein
LRLDQNPHGATFAVLTLVLADLFLNGFIIWLTARIVKSDSLVVPFG